MSNSNSPVALVTGAGRGLGRGIALSLAGAGFSVAINYAGNLAAAEETCAACAQRGDGRFAVFQADVGIPADRARLIEQVWDRFGPIDALINNAGVGPKQRLDITEATQESFDEVVAINLSGPYFLTQTVARRWLGMDGPAPPESRIETGRKVIFISSISAETASIQRGEYCISKAGVAMAAKLWATRLAGHGVQVHEIRPGIMATDMTAKVKDKYDALIADGLIPQMRWGSPDDVGRMVRAILCGDLAYSTGAVLYTDGGFHLSRL